MNLKRKLRVNGRFRNSERLRLSVWFILIQYLTVAAHQQDDDEAWMLLSPVSFFLVHCCFPNFLAVPCPSLLSSRSDLDALRSRRHADAVIVRLLFISFSFLSHQPCVP